MEQQLNLDIKQTAAVTCNACEGLYFNQVVHLRKASGILTGTGKTGYIPIPVFACTACGHVNSEFMPRELADLD